MVVIEGSKEAAADATSPFESDDNDLEDKEEVQNDHENAMDDAEYVVEYVHDVVNNVGRRESEEE